MNENRGLVAALITSGVFAILGFVTFVVGIIIEFFSPRAEPAAGFSANIGVALVGLAVSGIMAIVLFTLIATVIARRARERGVLYMDAYRLLESLRFREAIPHLEKLVAAGKGDSDVLMLLTSAYGYAGQFAKAQATADRAVQLYPGDETGALDAFHRAADNPLPAMYGVRVNYHLSQSLAAQGHVQEAVKATARMMSARDGLAVWRSVLPVMGGTTYGTALRYELTDIEKALADADAGNLG